jgi:hypothetical protein
LSPLPRFHPANLNGLHGDNHPVWSFLNRGADTVFEIGA